MTELTDLEICTRIAEIEGFQFEIKSLTCVTPKGLWPKVPFKSVGMSLDSGSYDPLTDDALCFRLMVKYKIKPSYEYDGTWLTFCSATTNKLLSKNTSPNKAICLAIIEKHKANG
jgi:hypothetical protein